MIKNVQKVMKNKKWLKKQKKDLKMKIKGTKFNSLVKIVLLKCKLCVKIKTKNLSTNLLPTNNY